MHYACLTLLLLIWVASSTANVAAAAERPPVFRVDIGDKTPTEVGSDLGRQVKNLYPEIESRYDRYLAGTFTQLEFDTRLINTVDPLVDVAVSPSQRAELLGLSNALSLVENNRLGDGYLSLDELWFLQLIPDIGGQTNGWAFGVYGSSVIDKGSLVGRNLDRSSADDHSLLDLQAITVFNRHGRVVVNVGFAGVLSVVTGFNDSGLFLAYLDASPTLKGSETVVSSGAIGFDLRRALESEDNVAGATRVLSNVVYGVDHSVFVAAPGRMQVLEHPSGQSARLRKATTPTRQAMSWGRAEHIAAVGCFVLPTTPANCKELRDRYRWQRLRSFKPVGNKAEVSDLVDVTLDSSNSGYALFAPTTIQSMVFDTHQQVLQLYSAPSDGAFPDEPVMQRYSDLTIDAIGKSNVSTMTLWPLWMLVLALVVAMAYARRLG